MYYISKLTETRLVTVLKGEYCEEISNVKLGRDRNEYVLANARTAYRFPTQPPAYDWSKNYIHKVLRWLSDKEFIKVVGIAQEGRYQAQQYVPTLTKDEYLAYMLEEQGVNNSLFARIAVTLFKKDKKQRTPEQDEKLIAELEKMVEYEAQIEEKSKEK